MFNPNARMDAYIIDGDRMFGSAENVLKFAQGTLTLFTEKSPIHEQDEEDVNIYGMDRAKFDKMVSENLSDEILAIITNSPVTREKVKDKESLCEYLWQNKERLPKPLLYNDREYMPQFPDKKEPVSEHRTFRVNNYQGNLLESLDLFNSQHPEMKVVGVYEKSCSLRILAK